MITVLAIMTAGIVVGFFMHDKTKLIKINDKLISWAIYLLLFLLGVSVGLNDNIINNIHTIVLQAIIITIGALLGSLICASIIYRLFFIPKKKDKNTTQS
ncbi:MAG: DUF340 domain-containing protein [Bacteroidia bacterium]|nr:MAG: DUF340 domain-containing protein [Bacteroidia bacterium]